jgi:isocitrate/isopropylmalate dehydrogenase
LKNTNNHYCYSSKSDLDFYLDNYYVKSQTNIDLVIDKVREKLEDLYIDLCKDLENQGYKEIEYQQSDECITENLISNDYDFTESGKLY